MLKPEGKLITSTSQGEYVRHKLMMTIFKVVKGFPVFHKFSINGISELITGYGFGIVNREVIADGVFPIAYIVASQTPGADCSSVAPDMGASAVSD